MKDNLKHLHSVLFKDLTLFWVAVCLFWVKTYIGYRVEFHLGIDNGVQQFLLFLNPLSSTLLFFAIALYFKGRLQYRMLIIMNLVLSIILYANIAYYRFFNDFITVPVILQTKTNGAQLGASALSLMSPLDILYFIDTLLLIFLLRYKLVKPKNHYNKWAARLMILLAVFVFFFNLGLAEKDRPDLLTRTFDRNYLVKYLGAYNFTIYDIIQNIHSSSQRAMADNNDVIDVENHIKANYADPNPEFFGAAKGRNVIYISLESLQTFLIDYKINGMEVTPFLNSLTRDGQTFYFDNIFHQTGQGKTSDSEFLIENSLYPISQGAVFITKAQNTFHAAPAILKSHNYYSAVFHGNYKTFWNRNEMYKSFGYDQFFDSEYYNMTEENTKNYGLKDKPFFEESIPMLRSLKQPFYAKMITLSNHFPFKMDEGDTPFPAGDFGNDHVVNHYFQSAHYMDEALEEFFSDLKASGLYNNSVIVMYGDHYGISENHNEAMAEVIGKEIEPFDYTQLQRVPLFIHVPGVEGEKISKFGGQIDIRPTVLHLLGVDTKEFLELGTDLFSDEHSELVPLRDGDFVSPELTQVDEKCYETDTGELIETSTCSTLSEKTKKELHVSDQIVYKDLLRFYQPKGFTPINRDDYQYVKEEPKSLRKGKLVTE